MKWLILILFISCGKHESPPPIDLRDEDGDQILNYMEASQEQKHIANFETLGAIKGNLKIHHSTPVEIKFSNEASEKTKALKTITGRDNDLSHRDYFSEWNDLKLRESIDSLNLEQKVYILDLNFDSPDVKPDELYLVDGYERTLLGNWIQSMRITLPHDKLSRVLSGKSYFSLKKNLPEVFKDYMTPDQSIKQKTYRVFLFDGKRSNVFYVSKDLSFENFKQLKAIDIAHPYSEEEIFFKGSKINLQTWYERKFKNGDQAIVYSYPHQLKETLLTRFHYKKDIIQRTNGIPHAPLTISSSKGSVYLRVKGMKTKRQFKESVHPRRYQRGGSFKEEGYYAYCDHYIREVSSELNSPVTLDDFMNELEITAGEFERIEEYAFSKSKIWELKLRSYNQESSLNVLPLPSTNNVIIGEYNTLCGNNEGAGVLMPPKKTSIEGNLVFEIESYVEKYQD